MPRTLNGKKCEVPVKRILLGVDPESAVSRSALQRPGAIDEFVARRAEFVGTAAIAPPRAHPTPATKGPR